jgi:hypothetical protein
MIIILIFLGGIFLIYAIARKVGYPKVGIALACFMGMLFLYVAITDLYRDELFSKADAKELLAEQHIQLLDNFELVHNESVSGIGDYYHTFSLRISRKDKERIIKSIKSSRNFNIDKPILPYSLYTDEYYKGAKQARNYETESQFIRELFEPHGEGWQPTFRRIGINKSDNSLIFEDIDD